MILLLILENLFLFSRVKLWEHHALTNIKTFFLFIALLMVLWDGQNVIKLELPLSKLNQIQVNFGTT
jgi:hypothetical protein